MADFLLNKHFAGGMKTAVRQLPVPMPTCPDYGSTVALVIIVEEFVLMVVLLANEWRLARNGPNDATEFRDSSVRERPGATAHRRTTPSQGTGHDAPVKHSIEDARLLEMAARANDAIVANIDAINRGADVVKAGTSQGIVALGLEYAREEGIQPLAPGERRPAGWVNANHETGRSDVPALAREIVAEGG